MGCFVVQEEGPRLGFFSMMIDQYGLMPRWGKATQYSSFPFVFLSRKVWDAIYISGRQSKAVPIAEEYPLRLRKNEGGNGVG